MIRIPRRIRKTLAWLVVGTAGVAVALALASPRPEWRQVADGVEHLRILPPDGDLDLLRFDLDRFRVDVVMPGPAAAVTARELRQQTGASAVVNGGFFDTQGRTLGLRIGAKGVLQGLRPRVDWGILLVRDRRASIVHSRDYPGPEGVTAAIQVGPRLVVDGKAMKLKPQSAPRTAVAIDEDGRTLTLIATRAFTPAAELARRLARLGFTHAMMLDGGPSTQMSATLGDLIVDIEGRYPVPDLLLVHPR